jgi:hypothetical protein
MTNDLQMQIEQRGWSDAEDLLSPYEAEQLEMQGQACESRLSGPQSRRDPASTPDFSIKPWFKSLRAWSRLISHRNWLDPVLGGAFHRVHRNARNLVVPWIQTG